MALPVALQLYSVRDDLQRDFYQTLKKVKDIGYAGVEFAGLYGHDPQSIVKAADELGLTIVSSHVPLDEFLQDLDGTIEKYRLLGAKFIAIPWLEEKRRPGAALYDETVREILKIGKAAADRGMTLLYHNHDFEFVKADGEYMLDALYRTIPAAYLQTEIDTCWVNVAGVDPAAYVRKYAGRAPVVHLKDFYAKGRLVNAPYALIGDNREEIGETEKNFEFRPIGYGAQNVPELLDAAFYAGAQWVVVEQDLPARYPAIKEAEMSRKYLSALGW